MNKKTKNSIIKIGIGIALFLIILFSFKGCIYQTTVAYKDAGSRKVYKVKDNDLIQYINQNLPNDETLDQYVDINLIIDFSLDITSKTLSFSAVEKEIDPNKLYLSGEANCIGYAAFAAAVGNYLIERHGMAKEWEAKPRKGKLYFLGMNMHKGAKSSWFKDHDFVVFRNKQTKEEIYVDPATHDYLGAGRVEKLEN